MAALSQHYTTGTLERLAEYGDRVRRRAATLALGLVADFRSNAVLGRRLIDRDRGVRLLADAAIREVWCRDGTAADQRQVRQVMRRIAAGQCALAIEEASALIDTAPWFAEAWNQRAIAYFQTGKFHRSANDCHQTLEMNPYHFAAAVGMGHCYLEMSDGFAALDCFRRALALNPGLEGVRAQVACLQRKGDGLEPTPVPEPLRLALERYRK